MPHDDVVVATRGTGTGARAAVSTVTMLNSVSTALPLSPQYRQPVTGAPANSPSVKHKPTASSKSSPGVRIVVVTR